MQDIISDECFARKSAGCADLQNRSQPVPALPYIIRGIGSINTDSQPLYVVEWNVF